MRLHDAKSSGKARGTPPWRAALLGRGLRIFGALASQGTVSLGLFITNLILIRTVTPYEFGEIAILLGALFFANNLFGTFVTYPMTLRLAEDPADAPAVVGSFMATGLVFALPIAVAVFAIGLVVAEPALAAVAALAGFAWLLQSVTRKALHAQLLFLRSAVGDALCHLGLPLGVALSLQAGAFGLPTTFAVLALTATLATLLQAWQCGLRPRHLRFSRARLAECVATGRLTAVGAIVDVLLPQLVLWTLLATQGKAMVAVHTAMISIVGISHPLLFSIQTLVVPVVRRAEQASGRRRAVLEGIIAAAPLAGAMGCVGIAVLLFPLPIITLFYGTSGDYGSYAGALRLLGITYLLTAAAESASALLLGLGRAREQRTAQLVGFATAVTVGLPAAAAFGAFGSATVGGLSAAGRLARAIPVLRR
ncbi:hypothetical protein [Falsiroseomonas sp. HW251]|uniref:hypothetical protein n=1 Tax=Falsiroseomonas sp. HW251 TaxID=3390998 RepID=UPI003D319DE0